MTRRNLTLALICGTMFAATGCSTSPSSSSSSSSSRPMTAYDVAAIVAAQPTPPRVAMASGDATGRHLFTHDHQTTVAHGPLPIQTADVAQD